ncbi:MAG: hypothetical protein ACUVQY_10295 [Thermoproteota archaeon]
MQTAEYQTSMGFYDLAAFSLEQALQLFEGESVGEGR